MAQGKNISKRFNIEQFLCSSNCNVNPHSIRVCICFRNWGSCRVTSRDFRLRGRDRYHGCQYGNALFSEQEKHRNEV